VKPRFQADADLNHIIVLAVVRREPKLDFQAASTAAIAGLDDSAVLALAASQGRILVSHDRKTMPGHFGRFITRQSSPGLLIVPQSLPPAVAAEDIILVWSASNAEEWTNRIFYLPI
jgi:hypothetical protein